MRPALCALLLVGPACGSSAAPFFVPNEEGAAADGGGAAAGTVRDASVPGRADAAYDAAPIPGSVVLDAGYIPFDGLDSSVPAALIGNPSSTCFGGAFCSSLGEVRATGSTPYGPASDVILHADYTQWSTSSTSLKFAGLIQGRPFQLYLALDPTGLDALDTKTPPGVYSVLASFAWEDGDGRCHMDQSVSTQVTIDRHTGEALPFEGAPIDLRGTAQLTSGGFQLTLAFTARYSCGGAIPL